MSSSSLISVSPMPLVAADICNTQKQKDMRFFSLTFDKVVIRFFLMMALIIGGMFAGQPLIALLALPLFLSALLGVSFMPKQKETSVKTISEGKVTTKQAA
jgi:hypothetical protein